MPASVYVAGGEREYGRYANPTWEAFEQALGALEGGRCLAYACGLAGVATVLDLVADGETVVVPRHAYLGTLHQLAELERRGRVRVRQVDIADTAAVVSAMDDAALVWVESPTNPALEVADLEAIATAAHEAGARVVADNTFATPLRQRPLDLGADVVVHSATKYLSGHADLVLGAVVTRDDATWRALDESRRSHGAVPGVLEAWLATRGLRTLALRVDRAEANARIAGGPARRRTRRSTASATPGSAASWRSSSPVARSRPTWSAAAPGCGCTPPASAAWSRRSSAGAGGPASPTRSRRAWSGCRWASRTSRTCGATSLMRSAASPREPLRTAASFTGYPEKRSRTQRNDSGFVHLSLGTQ